MIGFGVLGHPVHVVKRSRSMQDDQGELPFLLLPEEVAVDPLHGIRALGGDAEVSTPAGN
jgi:hypothetical protein